jgi:hypothetical protein
VTADAVEAEVSGHVERRDNAVALGDAGADQDAVEADAKAEVTAPAEAIQVDEHDDAGESAWPEAEAAGTADKAAPTDEAGPADEAPQTVPAAVTEALPTAEPVARISSIAGGARQLSWKIATAAAAVAVIAIALIVVAGNSSTAASHKTSRKTTFKKKAETVSVVSVSPGNGSTGVNGASPITVTYSGRITTGTRLPTLSPSITGSWQVSGDKATFTPQVGFTEDTRVTVHIPAPATTTTTAARSVSFTTGEYSILRLDQLLSQLGYIPVTWTPAESSADIPATDASAQLAAAYDPPAGSFSFNSGYPHALTSMWSAGTGNEIIDGAVRTFEYDQNLTMDGEVGRQVWSHLLTAIARNERNQHGYTYVWVTQAGTETLDLYHNGHLSITSPVNTGIAASNTVDGTFPVYLRYTVTQMQGNNPDGTPYNDTVYWVSYFNGGDAVHAFPRASYGWYQSLGCVELPYNGSGPGVAENVWNLITYGTLVTVTGPVA